MTERDDEAPLPDLTREDVAAFVQVLTALVMMGATRIEIHPARWPIVFRGLILHRAYDIQQVRYVDGEESIATAVCELEFQTKQGKVGCMLMQRRPRERDDETKQQAYWLDSQGLCYDVPEEPSAIETADKKLWLPS